MVDIDIINFISYYIYMKFINTYENFLQNGINMVELIAYSISFVIITISIFKSTYIFINEHNTPVKAYIDTRFYLGEAVLISLAFILGVEILKLFYIKSYKQLIIVVCLVAIKLLVGHFLSKDITTFIDFKKA